MRHDVIVTIITAAKRDLALVNDQALGFMKKNTGQTGKTWGILFFWYTMFTFIVKYNRNVYI